tara:strand:- start:133 stop:774 length:642 start_codon:yes stop_codon:yes gene_type:complete
MGSQVVWIDGCYKMTQKWVELSKRLFEQAPRIHMLHPKRFTYYEEIVEGFLGFFNTKEDCIKITETAADLGYDFKKYCSPVLACMWQTVTDTPFYDTWWEFCQISTRCDMIGFDVAKQIHGLPWRTVDDWSTTGVDFTGVGGTGRIGRRKLHPQPGEPDESLTTDDYIQLKTELLSDLKGIVKLHPSLYCKHWKKRYKIEEWVDAHVKKCYNK